MKAAPRDKSCPACLRRVPRLQAVAVVGGRRMRACMRHECAEHVRVQAGIRAAELLGRATGTIRILTDNFRFLDHVLHITAPRKMSADALDQLLEAVRRHLDPRESLAAHLDETFERFTGELGALKEQLGELRRSNEGK